MILVIPFFIGENMDNLFITIRHMISDPRMIYLKTALPQYKIEQVKAKLFYTGNEPDRDTCEWWLRLYRGDFDKADLKRLEKEIEAIK